MAADCEAAARLLARSLPPGLARRSLAGASEPMSSRSSPSRARLPAPRLPPPPPPPGAAAAARSRASASAAPPAAPPGIRDARPAPGPNRSACCQTVSPDLVKIRI
ncbi:atherin-like [Delphinus delphis]|uniref:atherin-like n=1 Tax=Delphinus delphis TaxID=9728 RepID=UPI0028C4D247|nr:sterile alpha motif domain-containing protein 1-like isoform X1 [Delphinus delphis]